MADPSTETLWALGRLRMGDDFQWYVIFMFVVVLYIYFSEVKNKNFKAIVAGLTLYTIHWFVEIINALIQHFFGNALWTVSYGSSFVLLVGVGIELSFMFLIAGVAQSKLLPEDKKTKMFGFLPAPLAIGLGNALIASVLEIFLAWTDSFYWHYSWWNSITVFFIVYIPFFVVSAYSYYWKKKTQIWFLIIGAIINIGMLIAFIPISYILTGSAWI
jgi:hypothetical protein